MDFWDLRLIIFLQLAACRSPVKTRRSRDLALSISNLSLTIRLLTDFIFLDFHLSNH